MHSLQICCSNKTLLKTTNTNLQLQQTTAENISHKNRLQSHLNFETSRKANIALTHLQTHPATSKKSQVEEEGEVVKVKENVLH